METIVHTRTEVSMYEVHTVTAERYDCKKCSSCEKEQEAVFEKMTSSPSPPSWLEIRRAN